MLDALALLPVEDIDEGFEMINATAPASLTFLVDYFDSNYVNGPYRSTPTAAGGVHMVRVPPRFPRDLWNVHEQTIAGEDRTNNLCEGWNRAFKEMVGEVHPGTFTALTALRKDNALSSTLIQQHTQGHPITGRATSRVYKNHQRRLQLLCVRRAQGTITIDQFLNTVGAMIRF